MSERCRWVRDPEIGRYHLPGCMGGAVYGPSGCTCARPIRPRDANIEDLDNRIARIERHLFSKDPSK